MTDIAPRRISDREVPCRLTVRFSEPLTDQEVP